jgi:hypothetical protein
VISGSPTELQPVLDTIASTARRLRDALDAAIILRHGESLRIEAHDGPRDGFTGQAFIRDLADRLASRVHLRAMDIKRTVAGGDRGPLGTRKPSR